MNGRFWKTQRVERIWSGRMNADRKIIIVSGSNGRIGDAVMRRLAGRFTDVVGFDRKAPRPPPPGLRVHPRRDYF